jgi:Na+/H+-dicarboxylate symporter
MKLIGKILVGIAVGILLGLYAPEDFIYLAITAKSFIEQFIFFIVPLIILLFITSGIANLQGESTKVLSTTVLIAYLSTILAALFATVIAIKVIPFVISGEVIELSREESTGSIIPLEIKPVMDVISALVLAFIVGIGIKVTRATTLKKIADEGRNIIQILISNVIIPILPFYIAGVFMEIAWQGEVFSTLGHFALVLLLAVSIHWIWLFALYTAAGYYTSKNATEALKNMLPAYITALGTMSSAATIPVTLKQTRENGVSENIADFTIPLCATIHLCGSAITITVCSVAVLVLLNSGEVPTLMSMIPFILLLGVIMVAAPGVPGGGVMAALGLLETSLGFNGNALAIMIALYVAQDSFGTACNVTGDGAIAIIVDKLSKER